MNRLLLTSLLMVLLSGCMTVYVTTGAESTGDVTVKVEKIVSPSTLPVDMKARDVTVPVSAVP